MRSASVDLPWSMCAMMQKFRIRAGSVNVLSAKLLMGDPLPGPAPARFRATVTLRISKSQRRVPRLPRHARTMLGGHGKHVEQHRQNLRADSRVDKGPQLLQAAAVVRRARPRGRCPDRVDGRRAEPTGSPVTANSVPDRTSRPQGRVLPRPRRQGRSGRNRLDLGCLRGGSDPGQRPPVLVVGRDGNTLLGLMLSSQSKRDGDRDWIAIGSGPWDARGSAELDPARPGARRSRERGFAARAPSWITRSSRSRSRQNFGRTSAGAEADPNDGNSIDQLSRRLNRPKSAR